ncbi:hypothetical protein L3Y34_015715 [Caenorhabditis briggsae]|uniref:Uncharacterized protein n=1 Tax=Caenorhabditis briggsae TaxID=6238 RepID=A0AAE9DVG7_CAEBR|nr:hypothetical protein L3Y34_015715 [Caenorhabditis briggsae]
MDTVKWIQMAQITYSKQSVGSVIPVIFTNHIFIAMLKLIIFFTIVSSGFCGKLSAEFDAERAEMCGKSLTPEKPSSNPHDDKVPWGMAINYVRGRDNGTEYYGSSILVSARHVIAPGFMAIRETDNTFKQWVWADETTVDFAACQENKMAIPKKALKKLKIWISICQDVEQCGMHIARSVIQGWYLGNCQPGEVPFGILLLEISSNVPQNEPFFVPVCLPAEKKPLFIGDAVHFDSLDVKNGKAFITAIPAKIQKCGANIGRFVQSVCATRGSCVEGRAGTLVKKIDGRETGVAVLYSFEAGCTNDHYVSIGFFKDELCSLAGICKTITEPVETSSKQSLQFLLATVFVILFL